jgi:hypothetical protein
MTVRALLLVLAACGSPGGAKAPEPDPCGMPAGIDLADLEPEAANLLVRRALACTDHRQGRISDDDYRKQVAALDAELTGKPIKKKRVIANQELPTRLVMWAHTVLDVSTQYSDQAWSANQVLGPPDVYPEHGDHNKAWASHGADDRAEHIEVGFEHPERVSGIEIYETFNAGAIDKVELITVKGKRIDVPIGTQATGTNASVRSVFNVRCTQEPVAAVRVSLDSQRVSGWNELDAIGIVPCTR